MCQKTLYLCFSFKMVTSALMTTTTALTLYKFNLKISNYRDNLNEIRIALSQFHFSDVLTAKREIAPLNGLPCVPSAFYFVSF